MRILNVFVFLSLVVMVSCKPTSETRVTKIDDQTNISESGIINKIARKKSLSEAKILRREKLIRRKT